MNYYVLFVMSGSEIKVRNFMNSKRSDWMVIFPMIERVQRRKGVEKVVLKPLFSCYLFVRTKMGAQEFHDALFELRGQLFGIIRELEYEKDAIPALLNEEVDFFKRILNDKFHLTISKGYIEDGILHVAEGSLMGFESSIVYIDRHKEIAVLEFYWRDRLVRVKTALEVVDKS